MQQAKITYIEAVNAVCLATNISYPRVLSETRSREVVVARQLITYYAYNYGLLKYDFIANELGYSDHSTCCRSITRVNAYISLKKESVMDAISKINNILNITS